jgi:hypothetical protein
MDFVLGAGFLIFLSFSSHFFLDSLLVGGNIHSWFGARV